MGSFSATAVFRTIGRVEIVFDHISGMDPFGRIIPERRSIMRSKRKKFHMMFLPSAHAVVGLSFEPIGKAERFSIMRPDEVGLVCIGMVLLVRPDPGPIRPGKSFGFRVAPVFRSVNQTKDKSIFFRGKNIDQVTALGASDCAGAFPTQAFRLRDCFVPMIITTG